MNRLLHLLAVPLCLAARTSLAGSPEAQAAPTSVAFQTADPELQRLFDTAEAKAAANIVPFTPSINALVEGGGYGNVWIETQPMGGEMYAKRNLDVARNNQLLFLLAQRADGRFPGMVVSGQTALKHRWDQTPPEGYVWLPGLGIAADFEMFQGFCFPSPAWRMYFWSGKDRDYLSKLSTALEKHDAYLWKTRDSNGDGLLESWCVWDTGEDHSTRLLQRQAPTRWPFDFPPLGAQMPDPQDPAHFRHYWAEHQRENLPAPTRDQVLVPFASMDVNAYSYEECATLAKIARELGTGREAFWRERAESIRARMISGLWDPVRHACFDRDRTGKVLPELIHNNLRCMWHGAFTQAMADQFVRAHLLNPEEFWTPVPLPSIAANDPLYRNTEGNSWSGQPQGLTYQRAIQALENYGHCAEVSLLGQKLLPVLMRNGCKFAQQLDAHTGKPSGPKDDGYGPMILAALEYLSRMHGIHLDVERGTVWWSDLGGPEFTYSQRWGPRTWTLTANKDSWAAQLDDKPLFSCSRGVRIITNFEGGVLAMVGIAPQPATVTLRSGSTGHRLSITPNQEWNLTDQTPNLARSVPFDLPPQG